MTSEWCSLPDSPSAPAASKKNSPTLPAASSFVATSTTSWTYAPSSTTRPSYSQSSTSSRPTDESTWQSQQQSPLSSPRKNSCPTRSPSCRCASPTPCPALFSEFSLSTTDLANVIRRCDSWDPNLLHSHQSNLIGPSTKLPANIPFAPAHTMLVNPEADSHGRSNVFIDNIFSAIPAISLGNQARAAQAVLIALAVLSWPVLPDGETLTRNDLLTIVKTLAEGTPTEELIVTGWEIDSSRLLVTDKHAPWTTDIRAILLAQCQIIFANSLKELGGRLQQVICVLQERNHFLSRIRSAVRRANTHRGTWLSKEEELDLARRTRKKSTGLRLKNTLSSLYMVNSTRITSSLDNHKVPPSILPAVLSCINPLEKTSSWIHG
jgi:hypothetical protein